MNYLSDFNKVIILNALCGLFPGCIITLLPSDYGALLYGIDIRSQQPDFSFFAPLGAGFSGFNKKGTRYSAVLFFFDLQHFCEHYNITLNNNEPAAN